MKTQGIKQHLPLPLRYNYQNPGAFIEHIATTREIEQYLETLLHFFINYRYKEGIPCLFPIYINIFEPKRVLQAIVKTDRKGNTPDKTFVLNIYS